MMGKEAVLSDSVDQVDMTAFLQTRQFDQACSAVADSLKTYGAVLVKDPRVNTADSDAFLNMMERYFEQPRDVKLVDARPELFYQVGVTPNSIERPRDNSATASTLEDSEKPWSNTAAREKDPKWRFFWRCGDRPASTDFPELNAPQVIPAAFESEWERTMNSWGSKLLASVHTVAEMLALGLDLPIDSLTEKLHHGPHLLAPTGSDLGIHASNVGTILAGYHYDINLLTIHGRSRYPGLYVWTLQGKRIPVAVPEGFLLVQSGVQLEYLTGGTIKRGMHEVVVSEETRAAARRAVANNTSMWRVSSTLFGHVRSDASLSPLGHFANSAEASKYNNVRAGEQIASQLRAVELAT